MTEAVGTHDTSVVEAHDLCVVRGGVRTCEFATFDARPGEVVALAAAEVALVRDALLAVAGLIAPAEGSLAVAGTELAARPARGPLHLRPRLPRGTVGVGVIGGVCDAVPTETVEDALVREFSYWGRPTVAAEEGGEGVVDYLGRFELAGDIGRSVGSLDPARCARLIAALAFACRPVAAVIDLTDAFVRGLSQDDAAAFVRLLERIAGDEGAAVLVGTTDAALAQRADRAFALDIDTAELLGENGRSAAPEHRETGEL